MKKKQAAPPNKIRIKKGDMVKVIAGSDKDKTGRVLSVDHKTGRLMVEGVKMIKRHTRPNPQKQIKGGVAERESSVHVSNVSAMTSGGVATRIAIKVEGEGATRRRTRIARKTGESLDRKG